MGFFMPFQFSQELIRDTILHFKDKDGFDISEEVANEYLMSLSTLYLAFAKPNEIKEINKTKLD